MTLISYHQVWCDLQFTLTNIVYNTFYCYTLVIKKLTAQQLIPIYFIGSSFTVIPGLNNPLAVIHPITLLAAYLYNYDRFNTSFFKLVSLWISLFLGGWWASQEFNWGGWWNWDLIESPILMYSLALLIYFHSAKSTMFRDNKQLLVCAIVVLLLLVNTRFLSETSVHSFVTGSQLLEKYSIALFLNIWSTILLLFSYLNLHNLLFCKYILIYIIIYSSKVLAGMYSSQSSKVVKNHITIITMLPLLTLTTYSVLNSRSYQSQSSNYSSCNNGSTFSTTLQNTISWYKEISFFF